MFIIAPLHHFVSNQLDTLKKTLYFPLLMSTLFISCSPPHSLDQTKDSSLAQVQLSELKDLEYDQAEVIFQDEKTKAVVLQKTIKKNEPSLDSVIQPGNYRIFLNFYLRDQLLRSNKWCPPESGAKVFSLVPGKNQITIELCAPPSESSQSTGANQESPLSQTPPLSTPTNPVAIHGWLQVAQGKIVDQKLRPVQLKGMSLFWSQWAGEYWNEGVVKTLKQEWQATLIRAPMGVSQEGTGYLFNKEAEKSKVITIVDAAIKEGLYVIIDWHDHHAHERTEEARAFFKEMAQLYGHKPNVIFEIYNEPVGIDWKKVKKYAEEIIGVIRAEGAQNLILVGTPNWSQDVDEAAKDPIRESNVAYTLHFYAASHKGELRRKAELALSQGIALFVTEWGTCDYTGNGFIDLDESQKWLDFMDLHQISWANWSLHDKNESASALRQTKVRKTSGAWLDSELTVSGLFIKNALRSRR